MPVSNLIHHIRDVAESLRPAERKVADMVLGDVDFAMRASITELAQRADVSEPSVTRFCRAVGAHGLRDFKMQLAQSAAGGLPYASAEVASDDGIGTLLDKVADAVVQGIAHARASLDPAVVEAAIAALGRARRVYFFGVGTGSGIVAQDAALRMLRLDIAASAFVDGHLQRLYAGLMEPGDVAFAISQSGRSVEVNESIQIAKERGATTIALTNAGSRLAWVVDIPLLLRVPAPSEPHAPGVSRLVHLSVIDALAIGIALRLAPNALKKMRDAQERSGDERETSAPDGA
ncbi:MurR/RpiR family transcriptional regulator [Paraburkholderia caballeronis]|uniref:DNA-binding transcriptional regulator, MurR/RpiR family, contains HTH and SIS domains n=1 Tax=Paraburkholderia caballeronis TaxID=416943 RepID=A0A1H7QPF6_9BURK|nr:MurR/RpiR family transcriptional regulator [Paraburkholderia caballeronis]PXW22436.1 RpiR family transcriptional regulator [Paraburkholderia caballeronis]PXW96307.1 RpiR family transcriptional regulator [Paraburkholderia caballeronis]RAJ92718.1 RpiR family transcriptional regulator [Paraburkholderia caballeronis]TDV15123.1 RpiR family transcriptional regulator [Paraburkholderia caballeronis]TDV16752.1 RpiR family transcriptional regulator [Paraburkholderia caballeronis]